MSKENKTSEAQIRASRRWEERNKERNRYTTAKRQGRRFIIQFATLHDLKEVQEWSLQRKKSLKNEKKT